MAQQNKITIAKFGGTSVADFASMNKSAEIITNNSHVRIVVLSASAGVTNLLIDLASTNNEEKRNQYIAQLSAIQTAILNELPHCTDLKTKIDHHLENINTLSKATNLATSKALLDEIIAHGELMSSLIFTEILKQKNVNAEWVDIRNVIYTDANFGKATPDITKIKEHCLSLLKPRLNEVVIVTQGFIGKESQGRTTTLGRGGSDYTAALLGEALETSRIDIWTDVAGIYTTDPRIVPTAHRIDNITFEEAAEMATFGAKILHPATLVPAIRSNIPVFVGSSKTPELGGTFIYQKTQKSPTFRALALRRNQTLLTLHSLNMLHARGFLASIFNILASHNISVDLITTSEISVALTLDTTGNSTTGCSLITDELIAELSKLCRVKIENDLSLLAVIGNQLFQSHEISTTIFNTLDKTIIRMACFGASSHNICLLVSNDHAEKAVQMLHKRLFE